MLPKVFKVFADIRGFDVLRIPRTQFALAICSMSNPPAHAAAQSISEFNPSLPEVRRAADALLLTICGVGGLAALGIGWHFQQFELAMFCVAFLSACALLTFVFLRGTWFSSVAFPILLVSFVGLHIQLAGGKTEFHFGVFVALAFLLAYRHWAPVLVGGIAVALHHIFFDRLQAMGFPVFCLPASDFYSVVFHAVFVVVEVAFGMFIAVRMRQDALLSTELECITNRLHSASGQVSFAMVGEPALTRQGAELLQVLSRIRDAMVIARESATQVSASSRGIADGSVDLSSRTATAADGLQRTASAVEQLTATVSATAEAVRRATELAEAATAQAGKGEASVEELTRRMKSLAESSHRVADITGVIDSISFQTNILALNAAVEAARAGDQGRGFAVVASEVRQLAKRSASAAGEIKSLVTESGEQLQSSITATNETRGALISILEEVRGMSQLLADVSRAANEQRSGIQGVNDSLLTLDQATQQNAALVEQSSEAAESLKDQAAHLSCAMASFEA
ncbi:methyl-accepting chemotaxis protein [Flavobacterium sp.]|uniref:methyl-accepting chemotaxis protein n=1 Tax=Flavobacterium sp. TaxID=239 RepID=UPI003C6F6683